MPEEEYETLGAVISRKIANGIEHPQSTALGLMVGALAFALACQKLGIETLGQLFQLKTMLALAVALLPSAIGWIQKDAQ